MGLNNPITPASIGAVPVSREIFAGANVTVDGGASADLENDVTIASSGGGGGGAAWGGITGTLSDQTDLETVLNERLIGAYSLSGSLFTLDPSIANLFMRPTGGSEVNYYAPTGANAIGAVEIGTNALSTGGVLGYSITANNRIPIDAYGLVTGWEFQQPPFVLTDAIYHEGNLSFGSGLSYVGGVLTASGGGAAWDFIPPLVADFPNFYSYDANNLVFNVNNANVGLSLTNPTATIGTNKARIATKALPGGGVDWAVTIKMAVTAPGVSIAGLAIYEAATGKMILFGLDTVAGGKTRAVYSYTALGTFGFIRLAQTQRGESLSFYRVERIGANIIFSVSADGVHFGAVLTETLVTDFTTAPDNIGFGVVHAAASTVITILDCPYWVQSW